MVLMSCDETQDAFETAEELRMSTLEAIANGPDRTWRDRAVAALARLDEREEGFLSNY